MYVPGLVKVKLNVAPFASGPESHDAGSLALLVVVCSTLSIFVHVTVSPTRIVKGVGEKANPLIAIFQVFGAGVAVGVGGGVVAVGVGGGVVAVGVGGGVVAVGVGLGFGVAVGAGRLVGDAVGRGVIVEVGCGVANGVSVASVVAVARDVRLVVAPVEPQATSNAAIISSIPASHNSGRLSIPPRVRIAFSSPLAANLREAGGLDGYTFACYTVRDDGARSCAAPFSRRWNARGEKRGEIATD